MLKQKPAFESIEPNFGHSYTYQKFDATKKKHWQSLALPSGDWTGIY